MLGEVLPYLELLQDNNEDIEDVEDVTVPDVRGMNIKEAKKILKEGSLELQLDIEEQDEIKEEETIIKEQTPKPGIMVKSGSNVFCDIEN